MTTNHDDGTTGKGQPQSSNERLKTVHSVRYTFMDINGIERISIDLWRVRSCSGSIPHSSALVVVWVWDKTLPFLSQTNSPLLSRCLSKKQTNRKNTHEQTGAHAMSFALETFIFGFADTEIGSDNGVVS